MVTMTSEMDKTQNSITMAAKSVAAESVVATSTNNSAPISERTNQGVSVDAGCEGATTITTTTITSTPLTLATKPLELSSVTISIELASDDDADDDDYDDNESIKAATSTHEDAIPAAQSTTNRDQSETTPKVKNMPTTTTPTTKPTATTTSVTESKNKTSTKAMVEETPITTSTTDVKLQNREIKVDSPTTTRSASATVDNNKIKITTTTTAINQCSTVTAMATVPDVVTDAPTAITTTASYAPPSPTPKPASSSSSPMSLSTPKVNFNISGEVSANTSQNQNQSKCTSVTNSSANSNAHVHGASISTPPSAAGGITGNGCGSSGINNASGAGLGVGSGSNQQYHHSQHNHQAQQQQQQQQQLPSNQHGKSLTGSFNGSASSSGSSGIGGANGSHTLLPSVKPSHNITTIANLPHQRRNEDAPNIMVYKKMEAIIEKMQAESSGVAVRTVKAFMSKVPSVFTGADLVAWILKNFDVEDVTEALHFAHSLASHGYIFPIDDHQLTVKNDGTFYRFQTPYFWPSNCWEPENTDYAVYLCKRTMQNKTRLELADYEAENLAKLQKMFSRKWEFIFMQAESQSKVAKKRDKLERKVLDSQERAFWDVHRPMPGCVNTTEIDIKKAYRRGGHGSGTSGGAVAKNPIEQVTRVIALRKQKLERRTIKGSKAAEAIVAYYDQYNEFDYFITSPELPNPWQTDSTEMWDAERNSKEVPLRRVKRWGFSLRELLNDPVGREQFNKFLEKEYSGENLKFWESVQQMKTLPQSEIKEAIQKIWKEFLAPDAPCPVNVDSKSVELAREAVNSSNGPNRWCFDVAAAHVYHLMKSDSYSRYLRSDMYKDYLNCSRKKIKSIPNLFGVKR